MIILRCCNHNFAGKVHNGKVKGRTAFRIMLHRDFLSGGYKFAAAPPSRRIATLDFVSHRLDQQGYAGRLGNSRR
jgi:hypothetical protein